MAMRTTEDVANMESELHDLRSLHEELKRRLVVADTTITMLKIENAFLKRSSTDSLTKAVKMETIMSQVSAGLVAGLKEMKEERDVERALRRGQQEQQLGVGGADTATFLERPAEAPGQSPQSKDRPAGGYEVDSRRAPDPDRDRGEQLTAPASLSTFLREQVGPDEREVALRGAAEMIAPRVPAFIVQPVVRPGRVDPTIADRDSRMPGNEYPRPKPVDLDEENLKRLADNMGPPR